MPSACNEYGGINSIMSNSSIQNSVRTYKKDFALVKVIFWREFNATYRRSALGPLWALIAPAAYLCVFIFFRLLFGLANPEGIPMIPFLFSGLTIWMLFSQVVMGTFPAIVANVGILKKIPISPVIFIFSAALLPLLTCGVYLVLLEGMLIYYGYFPTITHVAIPVIVCLALGFALGLGMVVATVAFYRQDIIQILPTVIQLGMFATPIFFSPSIIPEKLRWVININPLASCVSMFRQCLFQAQWPDPVVFAKTVLVVVILWGIALPLFRRVSRYIADIY